MLKTRIIPTLLWKDYTLVKGKKFDSWRRIGTIIPAIKVYNTRQVDELIIVDITATHDEREPDYATISDFSKECFMPLTIGGGISSVEHIKKLLRSGADKVTINSAAYHNPSLIKDGANCFGSQCIIASIDAKKERGEHICYSHSGKQSTEITVEKWAKTVEEMGAGEILITSIDQDGLMQGYDLELIQKVSRTVSIPVIAQGGCRCYEDMYQALTIGRAHAISAASIFHFTEQTPLEAKIYLQERGVPVRRLQK